MSSDRAALPSGTVAVVAGGARGIGRACALRLADLGARVAVLDIDLAAAAAYGEELTAPIVADELVARAGDGLGVQVDLTDAAATATAFGAVVDRWGRLDALVVPAGGAVTPYARSLASETTDDDLTTLLDLNLRVVVSCVRSAVPVMRAGSGGSIVTVGSSAGLQAAADGHVAGYGAAKAAVQHYTRYLANELGPSGIRVNCVAPGVVRTSRVLAQSAATGFVDEAALDVPLRRQGEPDDVADVVQFLVSPLASYVSGQVIAVSGGAVH